jgi:hypothetical protein
MSSFSVFVVVFVVVCAERLLGSGEHGTEGRSHDRVAFIQGTSKNHPSFVMTWRAGQTRRP